MMKKTKAISLVLVLSLVISSSSCKKRMDNTKFASGAYSSSTYEIPQKDGYEAQLRSVLKDAENTCISVVYTQFDKGGTLKDQFTDVITVNDKGEELHILELLGDQALCAVLENEYVFLGYEKEDVAKYRDNPVDLQRTAVFLDKKSGDFLYTVETDFEPYYIVPIYEGFVIVGASTIARYTMGGELIKAIKPGFSCYVDGVGFFEDDGKYYVIEEKEMGEFIYHEVNFETGSCPALARSKDIGVKGKDVEGQYYFNPDGEYKVNLSAMQVERLADWNCIDIRPPMKTLYTPSKKIQLDDERFAISYEYRDQTSEVILFHYDPSIDRSQVQTLKIGGYGVYDDLVLQWAVYTFNSSNKKYRVILEDYGERFDSYTTGNRTKTNLALTQYFNEGNTPDIFYGTRFDYEYMGRNGMVIDMADYVNSIENASSTMTDAAQRLVFNEEGSCYQLFAGYVTFGFYVQENVLDSVQDTSIFSLYQYAEDHDILYSVTSASDIVDMAIRYNFTDLYGAYDGRKKITQEELEALVSIVVSLPVSQSHFADEEDVMNGKVLMTSSIGYCYISSEEANKGAFRYIGYPSIHGSVYLAVPQCCLAISSTAKNKDACWEVLSALLSENAQKQTVNSGCIPVTKKTVDIVCEMALDSNSIKDDVLAGCIICDKEVTQADVDRFLQEISMVDNVATYDWGIFDIISEEINSYYSQNRSPEQITQTLDQRLTLYMQENYQ